jgi:hypothetical protein
MHLNTRRPTPIAPPVALVIQALALGVAIPHGRAVVLPASAALAHAGSGVGGVAELAAEAAAREGDDERDHEDVDVVGVAVVGHGEGEVLGGRGETADLEAADVGVDVGRQAADGDEEDAAVLAGVEGGAELEVDVA